MQPIRKLGSGLLRQPWLRAVVAAGGAAALVVPLVAFSTSGENSHQGHGFPAWVGTWASSPMSGAVNAFNPTTCPAGSGQFTNQTVRNIVYTSVGGDRVRIRLSNVFGTAALTIGDASVAVAETGAETVPGTMRQLQFNGQTSVTIPAGAEVVSDPVQLTVTALEDLAVSVYVPAMSGPATYHATAIQDSFVSTTGDFATTDSAASYPTTITCWMFADGVDVPGSPRVTGSVVAFGDSITDGFQSDTNANDRWPNVLARRLDAIEGPTLSVVDEGISGNQLLTDSPFAGVSGLHRLSRDVIDQPGAKVVIMLIGINDIGFTDLGLDSPPATAATIEAGYEQVIAAAHAAHLRIYAGTLTPFLTLPVPTAGYQDAQGEVVREEVNHWILTSHAFDGVINFAADLADPSDPQTYNPVYDSGDHLHPNDVGYNVMGDSIPLSMLLGQNQN
ncbi:MAG: SGNH/GDSL hydrolase family protein [Streptosporangiaceae bacterium]